MAGRGPGAEVRLQQLPRWGWLKGSRTLLMSCGYELSALPAIEALERSTTRVCFIEVSTVTTASAKNLLGSQDGWEHRSCWGLWSIKKLLALF